MKPIFSIAALSLGCVLLLAPLGAQDWTTSGNDAQRSNWLRSDSKISVDSVRSPDFELVWKMQFENEPRLENGLTPPVLLDFLISHKGFRSLAFVGGSDSNVFTVDTDLERKEWERRIGESLDYPDPTPGCPGGMTSSLTRPTEAALPAFGLIGSGGRRRSPGVSGVGAPMAGAITLKEERSPGFRPPEPPKPGTRQQTGSGRRLRGLTVVYALTPDGKLRTMLASDGFDYEPPMAFLPPNANAQGLIVVEDAAYVTTSNGCGGAPDGVWAVSLDSKKVSSWKGPIAGDAGPVLSPDGTIYVATTDGRIAALDGMTLVEKRAHKSAGGFQSSPVLIDIHDKDYLAVAAKDGSLQLFDAADLNAPLSKTPAGAATAKALATWKDLAGGIWVLAPADNAIAAWKIAENDGKFTLEKGWTSNAVRAPLTPIVVNEVVFAASGGGMNAAPAKLYAFEGSTGKALWDSGDAITAPAPAGGLSAGGSKVYLGTRDGTLYAFGFPIEH